MERIVVELRQQVKQLENWRERAEGQLFSLVILPAQIAALSDDLQEMRISSAGLVSRLDGLAQHMDRQDQSFAQRQLQTAGLRLSELLVIIGGTTAASGVVFALLKVALK